MDYMKSRMSKGMAIGVGAVILGTGTLTWLNLRPFGVLFLIYFAAWFYKTHYSNVKIQLPQSLIDKIDQQFTRLAELREHQPTKFCLVMCCCFVNLAFIGHILAPTWIVVLILIAAVFISNKYKIKIVTEEVQENRSYTLQPVVDTENDEFLPDVSDQANISLLRSVGDHADVTSLYSSDLKEDDDEDDKSESELYKDLLVPHDHKLLDIEEDSSESDDDTGDKVVNEITFKSGHFNADSSSDDDSITKGLNFSNVCTTDSSTTAHKYEPLKPQLQLTQHSNLLQNISLVPLLLDKIKSTAPATITTTTAGGNDKEKTNAKTSQEKKRLLASDSEDDSEFEFLNVDEMEDL